MTLPSVAPPTQYGAHPSKSVCPLCIPCPFRQKACVLYVSHVLYVSQVADRTVDGNIQDVLMVALRIVIQAAGDWAEVAAAGQLDAMRSVTAGAQNNDGGIRMHV